MKLLETLSLNPTTLPKQLALVFAYSEIGPAMNAHKLINYELECDLNNPYIPIKEELIGMLDERDGAHIMMQLTMNPLKKLIMCKLVMCW